MSGRRFLVLGGGEGWHANQLKSAAASVNVELDFATYESLSSVVSETGPTSLRCKQGSFSKYDAVLTRTMPPGSLEKITFRLAILHAQVQRGAVVNHPRGLEIAIDKFATLERIAQLGFRVPETQVVQSRSEAMDAFRDLGGDCVVKPLFGGEGRGVMRIQDAELAWYAFTTLEQLDAVFYVQRFVSPGGRDTRLLCVGDDVFGIRRENANDFRTNRSSGGVARAVTPTDEQISAAKDVLRSMDLRFASVDFIDTEQGGAKSGRPMILEVNAVPGWRGAQSVVAQNIADRIIKLLCDESQPVDHKQHPHDSEFAT